MKKTTTNAATMLLLPAPRDPETIMHEAHIVTHQVLSARHKLTAQQIMLDLDRANRADQFMQLLPDMCIEEEALRMHAEALAEEADQYKTIATRIRITPEERAAAQTQYKQTRAAADRARVQANALWERITKATYSAAADLTQAAALELWWSGNWRAAQKAAGHESNALRKAAGLTNTRTECRQITEDEYNAKRGKMTITRADGTQEVIYTKPEKQPVKGQRGQDNGFVTYEHRNSPKYKGYFAVWHRPAERAAIIYDTMDADSATAATYADNGGLNAVHDAADAERIQAMFDRAGLSERDRAAVAKAAARIMQTDAHTPEAYARCWAYGLRNANIYSKQEQEAAPERIREALTGTERSRISRIKAKLAAAKAAQDATEREWERIAADQTPAAVDLVGAMARAAAEIAPAAPVIRWTRRPYPMQHITVDIGAEEAAADAARRAEQTAHAADIAYLDMRRSCRDAAPTTAAMVIEYTRSQRTPETIRTARHANSAQAAAWTFVNRMTAADVEAWRAARAAEEAAEQAAALAAWEAEEARKAAEEGREFKTTAEREAEQKRAEAFNRSMQQWEAAQAAKKAAAAAEAAQAAELAERRKAAYNAAIRAAYAKMRTTYPKATESQRARARAAAEKAAAKVK